ncbi:thiazole/oxazole-forming peptide maturase SagC [Clostridium sporogenes]|uniref:streptolysin associated protein SagC n=1 Tax=Clostridium botulinum TaxID=1491 RepID=UPI0007175AB6|nr:streptolysin associated protein SagC [Clostridium botulinum]KRU24277.1 thiazole/oxazole-forming peptide maturase SagC [Clostridium sporogenes]KRU26132.1 thiazole/oxazole-forming peptide maturase SagC [Clostridium sporogenes]KRU27188.1 thiazole/oxazole-forming peptide maturase SagC [Clostridium sporogenes]KRU49048.1 thiazole/oxazole-forming peptide maturase SagC [Clostridium sporogenes]MBZ1328718.1 streptolysin associated protein SagC [Clostridium botulinum]
MKNNTIYRLSNNLRIYDNGENEIRFRSGLWNYNEAVLDLSTETENFTKSFRKVIDNLKNNKGISVKNLDEYELSNEEKNNLINVIDSLNEAGMLYSEDEKDNDFEISKVLLGDFRYTLNKKEKNNQKLLFISDNDYAKQTAKNLSDGMNINLDLYSKENIDNIISKDLTSNLDALEKKSNIEDIKNQLKDYSAILICMSHINMNLFRNINRVSIELKKPIIMSFIDGPFITTLSTLPPKTGCLECFEQRILSRLEDHVLYHKFIESDFKPSDKSHKSIIPLLNIMTNMVISEGFLINNFNTCKIEGRVLSIFVPTLEIQSQDLLRVPFCPACGNISKAKLKEINISTRNIVDGILEDINS